MATRRTPSTTMGWLDLWVRGLATTPIDCAPLEAVATMHASSIRRLVSDQDVRKRLAVAYGDAEARQGERVARQAVEQYLVDVSWICHAFMTRPQPPAAGKRRTRGQAIAKLNALATTVTQAANGLRNAQVDLGAALDIDYLSQRADAGNPSGFIERRKGWHSAVPRGGASIEPYLRALADDIREEAEKLQGKVDSNRQASGKLATYYPVVDMLTIRSGRLSSSPDFGLTAAVLNLLVQPDPPIEPDAVRKRF